MNRGRGKKRAVELTAGTQIGYWLLLRKDPYIGIKCSLHWFVRCLLCGNEFRRRHYSLAKGHTTHCPKCNPGRPGPETVQVGEIRGWWTVVKLVPHMSKKAKKRVYLCRCKCGAERYMISYNITRGASKSCGCGFQHFYNETRYKRLQEAKAA